ncbi:MAG: aspartate aminotransferase family protein [Deltaproteobacteria bacterium]|nr:aspartate aminotransferase family protein [Deltaproteobacteria bacterium]
MTFIEEKWRQGFADATELHGRHVNPQMMQVLRIIGFDKKYVKAQGASLWDERGDEYLDFLAGYSVFNVGHNNEMLAATLRETLGSSWPNLVQMDAPPLSAKLAKELSDRDPTGRLQYAYFGSSGSEAVECALKFARAATGRPRLLSFEGGFHGLSMGALSLCGDESWQEGFGPFLPGCSTLPYGDLVALEKQLSRKDVAAIILEPIQGEGGVRELSQHQWNEIQKMCRKYGTLLILDEIQTGMGRTGEFFAFEHWNLEPDLVCLSKALTNGMVPCSVTLGTKKVFEAVFNRLDRCVVHSSTFSENNLAMAAALAVLDQLETRQLVARSAALGELVRMKLKAALKDFDLVKDVRGRGLMFAVEFGDPKSMKLKMAWSLVQKANKGLFGQMITMPLLTEQRILTQVAGHNLNVLKLSPPLVVNEAQLDRFVTSLTEVVKECHRFPGGLWDFGLGLAKRAILPASLSP